MNKEASFKNKWVGAVNALTHKITGYIAGAFAIDAIAQGILQGRQAVDQMSKEKQELQDEIHKAYGIGTEILDIPEHKPSADAAAQSLADSIGTLPTEQTIRDLGL